MSFVDGNTWPLIKGLVAGAASFAVLGTVAALWSNPLFTRMTPADGWEITLLALLSLLLGIYIAIRRPRCSPGSASFGGIAGFLGVACPTCNKVLMLLFGGDLLLAYFEPIRLYVAAAGVLVVAVVTWREWKQWQLRLASKLLVGFPRRPSIPIPGAALRSVEGDRPIVTVKPLEEDPL